MRLFLCAAAAAALAVSSNALAATDAVRVASNGVPVTVAGGEFKPRVDYTAPTIKDANGAYVFAVSKDRAGDASAYVQGFVHYVEHDWRFYDRAYLAGGEPLKFDSLDRRTGECRTTGRCELLETYQLTLSKAQLAAAMAGGIRAQVGTVGGKEFVVTIPAEQVKAAVEVAGVTP